MAFLGFVAACIAAIFGYRKSRSFVRERLRYVDGVHKAFVPVKAGLMAAAVVSPIMWVLPVVTTGAAIMFGIAVGFGVAAGRRDILERPYLGA